MALKAIIPAAGMGTRFLPITKCQPKEMLPLLNKPLIHYSVLELAKAGVDEVILVIGPEKKSLAKYFEPTPELRETLSKRGKADLVERLDDLNQLPPVKIAFQEQALGLGHAIKCARDFFTPEDSVLILLPDELFLPKENESFPSEQLVSHFKKTGKASVSLLEVAESEVHQYGVISIKEESETHIVIDDLVEKPKREEAPSCYALPGRYLLKGNIWEALENLQPGAGGEYQLTDALRELNSQENLHGISTKAPRFDSGKAEGWLAANIEMGKREGLI